MDRPPRKSQGAVSAATKHWRAAVERSGAVGIAAVMTEEPADYLAYQHQCRRMDECWKTWPLSGEDAG